MKKNNRMAALGLSVVVLMCYCSSPSATLGG